MELQLPTRTPENKDFPLLVHSRNLSAQDSAWHLVATQYV